eukprot:7826114-Pyramimonas_sp.AAC.1
MTPVRKYHEEGEEETVGIGTAGIRTLTPSAGYGEQSKTNRSNVVLLRDGLQHSFRVLLTVPPLDFCCYITQGKIDVRRPSQGVVHHRVSLPPRTDPYLYHCGTAK